MMFIFSCILVSALLLLATAVIGAWRDVGADLDAAE